MKTLGMIIQIGGGGKGCGKTTLICKLLTLFPGTPTFKSGTHHYSDETEADTRLFLDAGASEAAYFSDLEESVPVTASYFLKKTVGFDHIHRITIFSLIDQSEIRGMTGGNCRQQLMLSF